MSELPKGWTTVALGDVVTVVSGATPKTGVVEFWDGDVSWATPKDLSVQQSATISSTARRISRAGLDSCAAQILPPHSVLLSSRAPIGLVAVNTAPMATNQGFKNLVPGSHVNPWFLAHWLRYRTDLLQSLGSGATFKELSKRTVSRIPLSLPPLNEQRRLAAILDRAASLSSLRKRYLKVLHSAAASLTHDLLVETTHYQPLGKFLERIDSGKSPVCEDRPAAREEWAVLKLGAISSGTYAPEENKALREGTLPSPQNEVRQGDLLFSRKNTRDLVGATAFVRKTPARRLLPDLIFRLILKEEADLLPEYVHAALSAPQVHRQLAERAGGSAASMVNISKAKLKTFEIPVPKFTAQREFVDKLNAIDELAERQREQLGMNGSVVSSLQSRAFRGEL